MVSTDEAISILEGRGLNVPYSTLARWLNKGLLSGAKQEPTPRGPVWKIPADAVEKFEPPKRGRTPKASKKAAKR